MAVRRDMSRRGLEDCEILQALMNERKRGRVAPTRMSRRKHRD